MVSPLFAVAKSGATAYAMRLLAASWNGVPNAYSAKKRVLHHIMDDDVQKSCWGLTAKAVVGFAVFLLLAWLISGGAEKAVIVGAG
ncbi:hypothetical protein [Mesorhizobium sp. ANAO-SY3R2]|uniref:hypothetical protein n=1 Tax=Mesorhizobium sp. ANAO-SY3R2 TaxID=3166644 RepID=UPI00366E309D